MDTVQSAKQILVDAEAQLRQMMEQALHDQRYEHVAKIARLAQGIAHVLQSQVAFPNSGERSTAAEPRAHRGRAASQPMRKAARAQSKAESFPRFERDEDRLVKVGWSKKNKSSYEHRAPKAGVYGFVHHLVGSVTEGKVFLVEDLLPVPDGTEGGELPAYQVYLILAWLRQSRAIEKKGRDGYVFRRANLDDDALEELWAKLPIQNVQ